MGAHREYEIEARKRRIVFVMRLFLSFKRKIEIERCEKHKNITDQEKNYVFPLVCIDRMNV